MSGYTRRPQSQGLRGSGTAEASLFGLTHSKLQPLWSQTRIESLDSRDRCALVFSTSLVPAYRC